MKNKNKSDVISFANQIEEIKSRISGSQPSYCKAEVYETWQNIFQEDE